MYVCVFKMWLMSSEENLGEVLQIILKGEALPKLETM